MVSDDAEWQGFLTWNDRVVSTEEGGEERFALDEVDADGRPHSRTVAPVHPAGEPPPGPSRLVRHLLPHL
jgi:hypothetical protein